VEWRENKIGAIKLLIFMEIKGSARFGGKHAVRPKEHGRGGKFPEIPTSAFLKIEHKISHSFSRMKMDARKFSLLVQACADAMSAEVSASARELS